MDIRTRQSLEASVPLLKREIVAMYKKFDKQFGLHGADIPMVFKYDEKVLGAYTPGIAGQKEQFYFSLFFIGYCNSNNLSREDKLDLFKHEYAHYMQYNMEIPKEYLFQPGKHGSDWKYCCSLVGAAPTEFYKVGDGLLKHDYEKVLKNPWTDKTVGVRDNYQREQDYRKMTDTRVQYQVGDEVEHPKFGKGIVQKVSVGDASVRLAIEFSQGTKIIDQKWLVRSRYRRAGD